ncbi:MAG: amino acid ABC transporter substrate-binding protein, partial [Ruminococcaceae bacterium]|nr:amino acid ABC transporter substrate-binding protein [Oscillospiraceae bacterium]
MKKIFALMLALCFVLTGCVINTSPENDDEAEESEEIEENTYTSDNKTYKIGFSGPLTGAAAIYGEAIRNAAQMAVDEINENGGLDGVKFELIATDDKHDPTNVATNFSSMLEKGMQVSLGTVTTSPGLEFKYLAEKENLFFLTPSASGDDIPNGDNGYQMCFADGNLGKVAASYVNENCKDEKVGIFYKSDDPYSKGIYDQFMANLDKSINPVITSFTKANETDFNTQIDTLSDCTFIFMPIYYTPASVFMKQAKEEVAADAVYYG